MVINEKYSQLATDESIKKAIESLATHGIHAFVVNNKEEARAKVLDLIPKFSEIMTMTSTTLIQMGLDEELNGLEYVSIRKELKSDSLDKATKQRLGASHEWTIGSVHAVTEEGQIMIASATGSQLGSYAYGASNVVWIIGTQKIVKNLSEATNRIIEYAFPLENERSMKVYGIGSGINKVLIINKEIVPGRIHIIFVKEKLGF